ncbi:MAG: HAMP domain-containing methyl-accepting chemotaxis protein [Pseudomonadota bacterium]
MFSMFGFFNNLRVKTKISLGFLSVLAILASVAWVGYASIVEVAHDIDTLEQRAKVVNIANDLARDVVDLEARIEKFEATGRAEDETAALAAGKAVRAKIDAALAAIKDPERRKKVQEVAQHYDAYMKGFKRVSDLKREEHHLIKDALDPAGVAMERSFETLAAAAAKAGDSNTAILAGAGLQNLMRLRLTVNKLLGRDDEALAQEAEKNFADLKQVMSALEAATRTAAHRTNTQDIAGALGKYQAAYQRAHAIDRELQKLIDGTMDQEAKFIATATNFIKDSAIAEQEAIGQETDATLASDKTLIVAFSLGGMVLGLALAWLIGAAIASPVIAMTGAMTKLAGGDKTVAIPAVGRKDEIGQMAATVQVFKDNAIQVDRMQAEQEEMKKRAEVEKKAALEKMAAAFEASVKGVVDTLSSASTELQSSAQAMSTTAEETQRQSTAVAAASEQASTNVQTVSAAAEELSSSITEISRQVAASTKIAGKAVEEAGRTNASVQGLAEAAQKIGQVVKLINDIAGQTNLLALNATIEAARAGEAGKGFAVVASEVKSLANQTAKATEDIAAQITAIQAATNTSVAAIKGIGATIAEINEIATTIASAVEEQGAATQEIARNVQQAAKGTGEVSSNIAGVTQAAGETGQAAGQVLGAAGELAKQSEKLRQEVDGFLANIRAA